MHEWTRGELQAFGAASNVLVFLGGVALLIVFYLGGISKFTHLEWLFVLGGAVILALGIAIRIYLLRTGRTSSSFDRPGQ